MIVVGVGANDKHVPDGQHTTGLGEARFFLHASNALL
jgi:hypothetical protein